MELHYEDGAACAVGERLLRYLALPAAPTPRSEHRCSLRTVAALPPTPSTAPATARYEDFDLALWRSGGAFFLRSRAVVIEVTPGRGARAALLPEAHGARDTYPVLMLALCLVLRPHGLFPLHAAALAPGGGGVLISAASGSGKSTLALALARAGWPFLSDDAVVLTAAEAGVKALPFRRTFALLPAALAWLLAAARRGDPHPADARKVSVPLAEYLPEQAADRCRPALLLLPTIADAAESRFEPARPAEALAALMRQSGLLTLDPDWTREHVALLGRLAIQVRTYRLLAGRDVLEAPAAVADRIARLLPPAGN